MDRLKLLALSGSLRQASYNTAALKALKFLVSSHIKITVGDIRSLPLFNPDLENQHNSAFEKLKLSLRESDGLIISSPEYAHGISGSMKNALDWLVSGEEFPDKPIMLINTSPRATYGQEALKEVLKTMSGNIIENSSVAIPLLGSHLDSSGIIESKEMSEILITGVNKFCKEIKALKFNSSNST